MSTNRIAYRSDESFYDTISGQYLVAEITENEAGYLPVSWHPELADAESDAARRNTANNLTMDDVVAIVFSSMRQGSAR